MIFYWSQITSSISNSWQDIVLHLDMMKTYSIIYKTDTTCLTKHVGNFFRLKHLCFIQSHPFINLALLLSNRISVIHGSRINWETLCCPLFCTYSYQILCHVGGTSPPTRHKIGNCRCEIVGRRVIFIWSLIHGSSWSGLIKSEPGENRRILPSITSALQKHVLHKRLNQYLCAQLMIIKPLLMQMRW